MIEVVDVHVGGDLHRIVLGGIKDLPGRSVLEQMRYLKANGDGLRQILLSEPRGGHPSLFADLVVPVAHRDADRGFIIMEMMGYPLISGTNTMSTVIALLETGRLAMREGVLPVTLEAPGGLIKVLAHCSNGKVKAVTYQAQTPSFQVGRDFVAQVQGWGAIPFDVLWTGAFYSLIDADKLGLCLIREEEEELVRFARAFIPAARAACHPIHPVFGDEGPLTFAVLTGPPELDANRVLQRRVCCYEYPRNSVCRSPAGVPSTAAAVQLVDRGILEVGDSLRTISIFNSNLFVEIAGTAEYQGHQGVRVAVTGVGWITMRSQLVVDFDDPLTPRDGLQELLVE
jgi:proline racemase